MHVLLCIQLSTVLIEAARPDDEKNACSHPSVTRRYFEFGGIRLEDVVVVTAGGGPPENLSGSLARNADEIEALMAKGDAHREAQKRGGI